MTLRRFRRSADVTAIQRTADEVGFVLMPRGQEVVRTAAAAVVEKSLGRSKRAFSCATDAQLSELTDETGWRGESTRSVRLEPLSLAGRAEERGAGALHEAPDHRVAAVAG